MIKLDFTKEYNDFVLDYMFREYEAGRTPNPDVLCNKFIKFGVWLEKAKSLGFDKIATGHYARLRQYETRNSRLEIKEGKRSSFQFPVSSFHLLQAKDENKDQTYFLHQLTQQQLAHVMFPLGDYTKDEVRMLAKKFELPTAEKEESMGICFVGEVPMKEFLLQKIKPKQGEIVLSSGEVIGEHDGLPFYTIGQRHLGAGTQETRDKIQTNSNFQNPNNYQLPITNYHKGHKDTRPLYVVDKDFEKNQLIVGYENDPMLYKKEVNVKDVNWITGKSPDFPVKCKVRLRHRQPLQAAEILNPKSEIRNELRVIFDKVQKAVTPGQFAVFYKGEECLGGGVIV